MMEIDGIKSTVQLISNLWYQNTCVSVKKKIVKLHKKINPPTGCILVAKVTKVVTKMFNLVRSYPRSNPYPNHVSTRGTLYLS